MSDNSKLLLEKQAHAEELERQIRDRCEDPKVWEKAWGEIGTLKKELKNVRKEIRDLVGLEELLDKSAELAKKSDQANRERRLFVTEERRLYELDHYLDKRGWSKILRNAEGQFMAYAGRSWKDQPVSFLTFAMKEGTNTSFMYARINIDEQEDESCCEALRKFPFVGIVCAYRFSGERKLSSRTVYARNIQGEPCGKPQVVVDSEMREFLPRTVVSSVDIARGV